MLNKARQLQDTQKSAIWTGLKIVLAVALAGYVFSQTSLSEFAGLLRRLSMPWLLATALVFCAIVWAMARRYWVLIQKCITFRATLELVVIQTVVGNLFAASAGVASYVTILRSRHRVRVSQGITSILLAKLGDLLILLIALALSSWMVWAQIEAIRWLIVIVTMCMAGGVIALLLVFVMRRRLFGTVDRFVRMAHLDRVGFIDRASARLDALTDQESGQTWALLGALMVYSSLTLALSFLFGYCTAKLFMLPLGSWQIMFITALTQLVSLIPVQVFGGLGVYEVTTMYLYGLFGLGQTEMAPVILGARIYLYLLNVLLMLYLPLVSYLDRRMSSRAIPTNIESNGLEG